jgi:hypothetical protein
VLFRLPYPPLAFEIPDEWWAESGADRFEPKAQSYRSDTCDLIVALADIAPLLRCTDTTQDHHGFRPQGGVGGGRGGMADVLRAIVDGDALPPVKVSRVRGKSAEGFRTRLPSPSPPLVHPEVEHVVQVDVCEQ